MILITDFCGKEITHAILLTFPPSNSDLSLGLNLDLTLSKMPAALSISFSTF